MATGLALIPGAAASAAGIETGDEVFIGGADGYGGTALYEVWPSEEDDRGEEPILFAYCIEQEISPRVHAAGQVGDPSDFLGENHFVDPIVQGKVLWVLAHSYPAVSLAEFGAAAGVPGISHNDAIEATQYAIWRYTELSWDADWYFETDDSKHAYWYLVDGANASTGMTADQLQLMLDVTPPGLAQRPETLVGPFTVNTNQTAVSVSTDEGLTITDDAGNPIDVDAVTDGQELYLDLRDTAASGSATLHASAAGASGSARIISVPTHDGGTPTTDDHAQTMILIAPSTARTTASATVTWDGLTSSAVPVIGTSLVDAADGDRILAWDGGTLVDTVTYENLTPGTDYTLTGELMNKATGESTGITGSITFTPGEADGTIDVLFEVPEGFAGDTLVAFEQLYVGTDLTAKPIAVHEDVNDVAQTVTVAEAPVPVDPTPDPGGSQTSAPTDPAPDPATDDMADESSEEDRTTGDNLAETGIAASAALGALALLSVLTGATVIVLRRRMAPEHIR